MEQLIVTPMKPYELSMGKTIPCIIISLIQMVCVLLFAVYWFDLPIRGSLPLFFLTICLFLISTMGICLFISTISATQQQAMMTTFFFIQPSFLLSGFVFPIANMPVVVQWLTYANPFRYILVITSGASSSKAWGWMLTPMGLSPLSATRCSPLRRRGLFLTHRSALRDRKAKETPVRSLSDTPVGLARL